MSSTSASQRAHPARSTTLVGGRDPDAFLAEVDAHMLALLERRPGAVADAARGPIAAGGKRMRPLLVLAARPLELERAERAPDADVFARCAVHAGAAVELVHTASLIHDDLLDGADLRRGVPTIVATHGRATAVAAGDLLFSLAFETLVECRAIASEVLVQHAVRTLARTARTLAEGEALQASQVRDPRISAADYVRRCERKTGVLFAAALQLGSQLADADARDVTSLARFGELVGTAFQLADDVLDCGDHTTAEILGKRPGADLRDGTITLPMLEAIAVDTGLVDALAAPIAEHDVEPLLQRIRATGALDRATATARTLRDAALDLLDDLSPRFQVAPLRSVAIQSVDRLR